MPDQFQPPLPVPWPGGAPLAFHLLAKPTGATCNLDCKYCFFLSKERLYPDSRFRMTAQVLELYLRHLLEAPQTLEVTIAWQGGEPTPMGLGFFERSIDLVQRYKKPGQTVLHTLQMNGTLVDDPWAALFKEHNFLVGLSIYGPKPMHDAYRVNKSGAGSFDQVLRGWETLRGHDVDVNMLCAVHAATNGPEGQSPEWAVAIYRLDTGAPDEPELFRSARLIGPDKGWLRGVAHDDAGSLGAAAGAAGQPQAPGRCARRQRPAVIQLLVSLNGTRPDGHFAGEDVWTGHGSRW